MNTCIKSLLKRDNMPKGLWPIEWLSIAYSILTIFFMALLWQRMDHPWTMLAERGYIFLGTILIWKIYNRYPLKIMTFVRITVQMSLLGYWYPDTYEFNRVLPNLDHIVAHWDSILFNCQPALEFSRLCPWSWFSEAVNLGYFSYYPMIVITMVFFFFCRNKEYGRASFTVMCSFFIYYLIYIGVPVAGPQFYFMPVQPEMIVNGSFPLLEDHFNFHTDMLPAPGDANGFFYNLIKQVQEAGERPTAAFPSSHVGITLILLYLIYPQSRKLFFCLLPFAVLLTLATVYIQAHYLVDVIAGAVTSYPVFLMSRKIYDYAITKNIPD